jgi:glucose/arabinose dehydrogenase
VLLAAVPAQAGKAGIGDGRGGVRKHKVGGFDQPIYVARAPGVRHKIYVVERPGKVEAVVHGHDRPGHFLDISGRTTTDGERGLLSIAFDPNYQRNDLFYAYYTNNSGNIEVDRFKARSDVNARESSRRQVIAIPHPGASNHNGGTIAFGQDGHLYLATGDGGTGGSNAQSKGSLLGKLLRIDPRRHSPGHTSPHGNPFVGHTGRNEIYAMGLRNPFRWSFDRRRITIGDVGENTWEEVDFETRKSIRGANFGWPRFEGDHRVQAGPKPHHYEPPIFEYRHGGHGRVITGGLVVRDRRLRSLYRRYLYADFNEGELRSFVPHLHGVHHERKLGIHISGPTSFTEGPVHRVYVAALGEGRVYKLVPK